MTTPIEKVISHIAQNADLSEAVIEKLYTSEPENLIAQLTHILKLNSGAVTNLIADILDLSVLSSDDIRSYEVLEDVSYNFLVHYSLIPLIRDTQTINLVVKNPFDDYVVTAINLLVNKSVELYLAEPNVINRELERILSEKTSMSELAQEFSDESDVESFEDVDRLKDLASEAPVVRLVNLLVSDAIKLSASDIHIEPFEESLRVRYRVDGILQNIEAPPVQSTAAIVSRIKIMAKLDIAERRLPQDGRIKLRTHGHHVDLRISTIPSMHGESVVIRILNKEKLQLDFDYLGFNETNLNQFRQLIHRQQGIVLVTGPTGSGKTTTLYTALAELNDITKKIMTVEDPVEYQIDGIVQMQAKPDIGLGFAQTLRSIVRQDPDVIMIGEMRDQETARIAMQSALTGHLVLSTLHTNDVGSSITRLLDIGTEPYLITSTISGIVAQRLVRKLCENCKQCFEPTRELIEEYGLESANVSIELFRPKGCEKCFQTGYMGRTIIIEQLEMTDRIRTAILKGDDGASLQKLCRQLGMKTMREDGIKKALQGVTSLEEVLRVTQGHA